MISSTLFSISLRLRLEKKHLPSPVMLNVGICHSISTIFYKDIFSPISNFLHLLYPPLQVISQPRVKNFLCKAYIGSLITYLRTWEKLSPIVFHLAILASLETTTNIPLNNLFHSELGLGTAGLPLQTIIFQCLLRIRHQQ